MQLLAPAVTDPTPLLLSVDPRFGVFPLLRADGRRARELEEWD